MENLADLLAGIDRSAGGRLGERRQAAAAFVRSQGLPGLADEAWKYTSLAPLKAVSYRPSAAADAGALDAAALARLGPASDSRHRAVFVNGHFRADLSTLDELPDGVSVHSIAHLLDHDHGADALLAGFGAADAPPADAFMALNTALLADGAVVDVGADCRLDEPLHLVFVSVGPEALLNTPRIVVRAARHGRARIIEEYLGSAANRSLTNAVTELALAEGAVVHHHRLQSEPDSTAHIGRVVAHLESTSELYSDSVAFGGALTRIEIDVALKARGARCRLNGLFSATGTQHIDHHTTVDHLVGDTHSEELYRGVLDGRSRGVFNGKVVVHRNAQGITARQASNNLLLSRQAEIDTKPELQIFADDVACTHGATVGELDEAALFYLRSRGIGMSEARALLTYAFAEKVIESIPLESLRRAIEHRFVGHHGLSELFARMQIS